MGWGLEGWTPMSVVSNTTQMMQMKMNIIVSKKKPKARVAQRDDKKRLRWEDDEKQGAQ